MRKPEAIRTAATRLETTAAVSASDRRAIIQHRAWKTQRLRRARVKNLRSVKHRPAGRLDHPGLQRAHPGFMQGEMGFELRQGAVLPCTRLLQERWPLKRTKCRRLAIQRRNGAIAAHIFQNCLTVHRPISPEYPNGATLDATGF